MTDEVTITLSRERADRLSNGMADLLCWCRGFRAAIGPDTEREPFGDWAAREMNIELKDAISRAERKDATK